MRGRRRPCTRAADRSILTIAGWPKRKFQSIGIGVPTLIAFLVAPKMGPIYDVPPKHRTRTQGDKQSGAEDKASEKPEGPRSDE